MSHKKFKDFLLQVTRNSCFNLVLIQPDFRLLMPSFAWDDYPHIIWYISSVLTFQDNKAIINSPTSYRSFKNSIKCTNLLFLLSKLWLCYLTFLTPSFNKLNSLPFSISTIWFKLLGLKLASAIFLFFDRSSKTITNAFLSHLKSYFPYRDIHTSVTL